MKNDSKKPVFEPVSIEEAKKIRATRAEGDNPPSGTLCTSGVENTCSGKFENDWCCVDTGYRRYYGRCQHPSGTKYGSLQCIELPGVFPGP